MKMNAFTNFCLAILLNITLFSCKKENTVNDNNNPCIKLALVRTHPFTPVIKGDEINISVDSLEDAYYTWTGPGNYQSYSQNNTVSFYADYSHRGWYYVNVSYNGCNDRYDSVYVSVKFPQGTPGCSIANNNATFNSALILGNQSFTSIFFGGVTGGYGVTCNSSNGDLNITMSSYWLTNDFEDGIYYTSSNPLPDYADIDKVFISDVNQGIYWVAEPGKPVYISHVGGKRRITFCDIPFSGSLGGTLYHATIKAQITQP